jgi:hypothetical protein
MNKLMKKNCDVENMAISFEKNNFIITEDIKDMSYLSKNLKKLDNYLEFKYNLFHDKLSLFPTKYREKLNIIDIFTIKINITKKLNREVLLIINKFPRLVFELKSPDANINFINKLSNDISSIKFLNNTYPEYCKIKSDYYKLNYSSSNKLYINNKNIINKIHKLPKYLKVLELNSLYEETICQLPKHMKKLWILNSDYKHDIYLNNKLEEFICPSENNYNIYVKNLDNTLINEFPKYLKKLIYGGTINKCLNIETLNEFYYLGKSSFDIECENLKYLKIKQHENQKINIKNVNEKCKIIILLNDKNNKNITFNSKIDTLIVMYNEDFFPNKKLKNLQFNNINKLLLSSKIKCNNICNIKTLSIQTEKNTKIKYSYLPK